MARKSVRFRVDLRGLEKHFNTLELEVKSQLDRVFNRLQGDAEAIATEVINALIYRTPERGGYKRTGALRDSIEAVWVQVGDRWSIILTAVGGAGGRRYALFNEAGTYDGAVSLQSILARARANKNALILLEYGDPVMGLEPRPWTIPTVVMLRRDFPKEFTQAVIAAEKRAVVSAGVR